MVEATTAAVVAGTRPAPRARAGLLGIGLEAYWPQFPGLKARIEGYGRRVEERLAQLGADVVSAGLVDTAPRAREAGDLFASSQVDVVFCHAVTYATSSQVLPALQAAGVPVVLLGLQPTPTLDYANTDTGEWLANCAACCVPEIAGACTRAGIAYDTVAGTIDDDERAWSKIAAWVRAAGAARALRRSRLGFLGHTYPGMLDMYTDFTAVHAQIGAHVEVLEIDDLAARTAAATGDEIAAKEAEIRAMFAFADPSGDPIAGPITDEQLAWSSRVAAGLDRLVADFELDGLTYYYRGVDGNEAEQLGAGVIVGNSLLTARGVITSGEGDLKTNIAQLLLDRLGAGGSFTEFYALDFEEDFVLMGHDGPGHVAIAQERPTLRALKLYHGKSGGGLSVEFKVRYGPVTIVGCTQTADGRLKLVVAEGESVPGDTFRIGNTNSRLRFAAPPAEFFEAWCAEGPTHHVALGVGHTGAEVQRVAALLGLGCARVGG
ncbi:MAG TPA: L-fucose/L-arabinose isomerase family protein [Solirubrobacteraceae bacterium]|jgi:L-arabinose isomerase|nr:L-fucose/L-arabinose isomerase family protein [Solirubrobacteraceae bacterium]